MKKIYFIFLTIIIISCNNLSPDAAKYNQKIIKQHQLVILEENTLCEIISKNMPKRLDEAYNKFLRQIDKSTEIVKSIEPFDNDTVLNKASIKLFAVYKEVAENEYTEVIRIAKIPDDDYTQTDDEILKAVSKEINGKLQSELDVFIKIQKEFANKYDFELITL